MRNQTLYNLVTINVSEPVWLSRSKPCSTYHYLVPDSARGISYGGFEGLAGSLTWLAVTMMPAAACSWVTPKGTVGVTEGSE